MDDAKLIRGRIAPSPSGAMHLGNAFSALLAWASARSQDGDFVLRLEDLDERCKDPRHTERLLDDLAWLGIDWDGEPVIQTKRIQAYDEALEKLGKKAELYPCFCTRADLHQASAPHASDGTPLYAGTCYGQSQNEIKRKSLEREGKSALRLHMPEKTITFEDGLQGPFEQDLAHDVGDIVLRRSDGIHAYQLVCVVDDIESGITEVVRARDLLSSTPRQIYLYELLGADQPRFIHHPLLLASDGRRLSKRDADLSIESIRAKGVTPEEVIGKLAYLAGQIDEDKPLEASELVSIFDWSKVPTEDITVSEFFS